MDKDINQEWEKYQSRELYDSFNYFGAHIKNEQDRKGILFTLWAPNASEVSLVGSFNYWNDRANMMERDEKTGVWKCFFPDIGEGEVYKYKIFMKNGNFVYKADPYAFYSQVRPETSSVTVDLQKYQWNDEKWLKKRNKRDLLKEPINIYEVHLGSWKMKSDGTCLSYRELADDLIPYMKEMNYNFLEIMPIMEHPYDGSWGYQTTGYYAITSRYGKPDDLMYLIDRCHLNDIGVILDWVPGHFCRDEHGLLNFDGEELYGGIDHPNWGTKKFDFGRRAVKNFLISNANFYFDYYHIDGIRVDGVTSILQLNFGIDGTPFRNQFDGTDDLNGIDFLKELNTVIFMRYPFALMAAEESTAWPLVTYPVDKGGLGFNFKWNMGWMNDTLSYISKNTFERRYFHDKITFSIHYAFSENFILPFSHDEVVHGKKNLIDKASGTYEEKFKNLKLMALYQMTHPGKKLNFMGNEIAQFVEWRYYEAVEWFLLGYPIHNAHHQFIKELNRLYMKEKALWKKDNTWDGFQWIDVDNSDQSIYSYVRKSGKDLCGVVLNFTNQYYEHYRIGVPESGDYEIILNSDNIDFYGTGQIEKNDYKADPIELHGMKHSVEIKLPGLTGLIIKKKKSTKKRR
jgi:1,4-alpha-glucan branching enzyme